MQRLPSNHVFDKLILRRITINDGHSVTLNEGAAKCEKNVNIFSRYLREDKSGVGSGVR